jgi:hypothetical protein
MNEASLQQSGCVLWFGSRIHLVMAVVRINQSVTHCLDRLHQITHPVIIEISNRGPLYRLPL